MEKKLKALFDFQRFSKDPRLSRLIEETEERRERELSEEELSLVSAAGETDRKPKNLFPPEDP